MITLEQIEDLKEIFAVFTPQGWAIPEWLVYLEDKVTGRVSTIIKEKDCEIDRSK